MRPTLGRIFGVVAATLMLTSCSTVVEGTPISVFADPFKVAGMEAVDGPTGVRDNAIRDGREVEGSDGGEVDQIAALSVSDIEEYWRDTFADTFPGAFAPVNALMSWDSDSYDGVFCQAETRGLVNAAFCPLNNTIGWDRGVLLPRLRDAHGDMAITMVLAHEYGHSIQRQAKLNRRGTPTLVAEQQADCFSGAYMRWVAEGNSPRFTLGTGDGLNDLLVSMISFRDPLLSDFDVVYGGAGIDEHGSAFERISAFQFGFTDGPASCAAIDAKEIKQRRGDLPVTLQYGTSGEIPVSKDMVIAMVDALNRTFRPTNPPKLSFAAKAAADCPDARPSPPVSFCPDRNTIVVDLPALAKLGTAVDDDDSAAPLSGDNSAFSILMSRYMLALQHEHGGLELDSALAGLRTACMTGVATTKLSQNATQAGNDPTGRGITLTAGDVDEAVAGLLSNGLVASDVNGETVPAGFSRIDAFRIGVLGSVERCIKRFP